MSDQNNALFRKAALDKLSSPERLDVLMAVTSPRAWLALLTIAGLFAGLIVWGIYGSIPTRIEGQGILIRGGTLREIRASNAGTLSKLALIVNETVQPGMKVAIIEQRDLDDGIQAAREKYQAAQARYRISQAEDRQTVLQNEAQIARIESDVTSTDGQLRVIEAELVAQRERLAKGFTTKARVQALEQQVLGLQQSTSGLRLQINNLRASSRSVEQKGRAQAAEVENMRREIDLRQGSAKSATEVVSSVEGRVVELKKANGDSVRRDEVIAVVEPPSLTFEPIAYVDAAVGKRILVGMDAQIAPSTVKREEFGFMKGSVRTVGDYPVTPAGIQSVVANDALAGELLGKSSKIEVRAALVENSATPSGYEWSSSVGPPFKIESGTKVTVSVVVERRAPIKLVLPMLKGALGIL